MESEIRDTAGPRALAAGDCRTGTARARTQGCILPGRTGRKGRKGRRGRKGRKGRKGRMQPYVTSLDTRLHTAGTLERGRRRSTQSESIESFRYTRKLAGGGSAGSPLPALAVSHFHTWEEGGRDAPSEPSGSCTTRAFPRLGSSRL